MIGPILQLMESAALKSLFLKLVNMSISASWLILAVLILRLMLKKAPKWVNVLLWGIVAVRLICPFSIESALSLIPSTETIPMDIELDASPAIDSGINAINHVINPVISASFTPAPAASANPLQIWIPLAAVLWVVGIAVMLLYTAVSYWRLRRKVETAVLVRDNILQSESVSSPFVLGIIRPRIYLPFHMDGQDLEHVIAHEQAHIRRHDHWWKPLGFLLLTVYWFTPLMWLAYILLCRDIELACDEKVIKDLNCEQRADYTQTLLNCSIGHRSIAACPLAFGEVGIKERVKSVMNYKKPTFWIVLLAAIACVAVAVCFLTNPKEPTVYDIFSKDNFIVLEQKRADLTLSVPKSELSDAIYTSEGQEFENGEVVAYRSNTTTIYLKKAMLSNESDDLLYFIFDFSFDFSNYGSFISPFSYVDDVKGGTSSYLYLGSKDLRDIKSTYPNTLSIRGYGPGTQFAFYVSKDACNASEGKLLFDIVCSKIFYAKSGYEDEAFQLIRNEDIPDTITFKAEILEIHDGYFLVKPESSWAINSADRIEVSMQNLDPAIEPQVGDILSITYNGVIMETYPARLGEVYQIEIARNAEHWDMIPMVMVNGVLYLDTGYESTLQARCGVMDGEITSSVDGGKPTQNDQSNFGTGYGYQYGTIEGTIEILINDKWWIYATEEARHRLQFPTDGSDLLEIFHSSLEGSETTLITDYVYAEDGAYGLRGVVQYTDETGAPWKLAFILDEFAYPVAQDWGTEYAIASRLSYLGSGKVKVYVEHITDGTFYECTMTYSYDEAAKQTDFVSESHKIVPMDKQWDEIFLHMGLNAEIVDIDEEAQILYVKDTDPSANIFGERCGLVCTDAAERYNLLYVNYDGEGDVRTIDFSDFMVGDSIIVTLAGPDTESAYNGVVFPYQVQLGTQRMN